MEPTLDLHKDQTLERSVDLSGKASWIIGRSAESDIQLAHSSISRRHARVFLEDGGYYVDDLGSTHGTIVSGQPLKPGAPVRLFDGLRITFGTSSFEIVPKNMMAAVMAAMRAAQAAQAKEEEAARQAAAAAKQVDETAKSEAAAVEGTSAATAVELSDAHRRGAALLDGGERGVAASDKASADEEALRAFLPMGFGKTSASGVVDHAVNARPGAAAAARGALSVKEKRAKKGGIQMGINLGASIGAGAGLAVPAATPTLAALQEKRAKEAPTTTKPGAMAPPPLPKRLGASLPARPPTSAAASGGAHDEDDDEVGPAPPPGFAAAAAQDDDDEAGPPLPPGFAAGSQGDGDEEIVLKGHTKMVTCLATDRAGNRVATGSSDHDVRLWDFGGMTSELKSFRHLEEPLGGYQLRSLDFSPNGDRLAVAGSSNQPCILDREGRKLTSLMKGDMYIRDMRNTKGHVASCTSAKWHPSDGNTLASSSEDGTVRLWDAAVATDRGDDAMSLSVQSGQRSVMVLKDARGIKSAATAIAWHADGNTIMCGARDGSLQLWELRASSDFQPVVLLPNATPKSESVATKAKAASVTRGAHAPESDVSCVRWHRDGYKLASRSTDGTLKLWDIRRFDAPLGEWGGLDCLFPTTGCDFSPDGGMLVTGSSVKKGTGSAQLTFVSTRTLERVAQIPVDGASIVGLLWHPRLNQLLVGNADGGCYVHYDPEMSEKGAMLCAGREPPKRSGLVYTGGAMQIHTPHALPMYKDEELDHRKRRRKERHDPLKSHKPEYVKSALGTGGKLQVGYQQALLASMSGGVSGLGGTKDKIAAFKVEDPREEILKYAKIAAEDPHFVTPAYAKSQPQVTAGQHLAKTVDSDDEEEK